MATARKHHDSNTIVRWNLMMLWIMATVAGLLTGVIVQSVLMASGAIRIPDEPVMALFPLDYSLGMILGSVQAILMRRHFSLPVRLYWVIANGLAFPLAEQVSSVLLHDKFRRFSHDEHVFSLLVAECCLSSASKLQSG